MKTNTVKPVRRISNAKRPHIVGSVVTLRGAQYLWLTDRSKYPGAKIRELAKRLPRRQRVLISIDKAAA